MELVGGFLQQSVEKIDRTRQVALEALHHIVHSELELVGHEILKTAVPLLPYVNLSSRVIEWGGGAHQLAAHCSKIVKAATAFSGNSIFRIHNSSNYRWKAFYTR